ncbi:MAG: CYTH domain-containing protein [Coprobacillus sp.]|nr:CYTH domain-containing protein [Coprobacillus sp.]
MLVKEIEKRSFINEEQYMKMCAFILRTHSHETFKEIANTYYDDENGTLAKNHLTLRLREDEKTLTLTLKEAFSETEAVEHSQEIELEEIEDITKDINLLEGEVLDYLKEKELDNLILIEVGKLKTRRLEVENEAHIKIILDMNEYKDTKDYDIEVEADSEATCERALKYFSDNFHFKISKKYISKHDRAVS